MGDQGSKGAQGGPAKSTRIRDRISRARDRRSGPKMVARVKGSLVRANKVREG